MKTFRRCRRQWWLHYVRKLDTKTVESSALTLGSLTHLGEEVLYERGTLDDALDAVRDEVMDKLPLAVDEDAWRKQGAEAQNYLVGYWEWLRSTGSDQRYEHVASEEELEMPLITMPDGTEWIMMGKLDRRVWDRWTERMRFMDFKTVASFDQFIALTPRDEQFPVYELLLQNAHTDEEVMGGVWRMILKRQRARNGDGEFFRDHAISFNKQRIFTVHDRLCEIAMDMHTVETHPQIRDIAYPTPAFSCGWDCAFAGVCDMFDDGSRVESALSSLYVVSDPYERYKINGRDT